jgi:hypothetical protein
MKLLQTLLEYIYITPLTSFHRQPIFWVAVGAFAVRLWGITYGLPDLVVPDEASLTRGALTMLKIKTLIPALHPAEFETLYYPPLTAYLYMPVLLIVVGISYLFSSVASLSVYTTALVLDPSVPWMATRAVSAGIGALTVYVVGRLAERMYPGSGIFAALFLATSFLHVTFSHIPRHWALSLLLITGMVWAAYHILHSGARRWYVLGGLAAGLGAGAGVVPLLLGVVPGLAHLFRPGSLIAKLRSVNLWLLIGTALFLTIVFGLLHPPVIFGHFFGTDWQDNTFREQKTLLGAVDTFVSSMRDLAQSETILLVFALVGAVPLLRRHFHFGSVLLLSCAVVILAVYIGYYYLFHYLLLILPILVILAGIGAYEVVQLSTRRSTQTVIVLCMFALPALVTLRFSYLWSEPDSRHSARAYIEEHIPQDARLISHIPNVKIVWPTPKAIEDRIAFDPDSSRITDMTLLGLSPEAYPAPTFSVFEIGTLSQNGYDRLSPEFLTSQRFDYLLVDRFAAKYPSIEALIAEGELVASFPVEGPAIDVIANEYGGPSTDVFRIQQLGPRIDIIKLSQ